MGEGTTVVATDFQITLRKAVLVEIIRSRFRGMLIIDGTRMYTATSSGRFFELNLQDSNVFLGISDAEKRAA